MTKRHMNNFQSQIEEAGGKCSNLQVNNVKPSILGKTCVVPVEYSTKKKLKCEDDLTRIVSIVQQFGRRMIQPDEIDLALKMQTISKYCNPDIEMIEMSKP